MNALRAILHVCLSIAVMLSPAAYGQTAQPCSKAKMSCCGAVCPCAHNAESPATPMPVAPPLENKGSIVFLPGLHAETAFDFSQPLPADTTAKPSMNRERDASRMTSVPLHLRVCVFLV